MPIKIVSVYSTSDGSTFQNEDAAKACEINLLAGSGEIKNSCADDSTGAWVVAHAAEIIAILNSRPDAPPKRKPRSDKGRNHKRKEKFCHGAAVTAENEEAA